MSTICATGSLGKLFKGQAKRLPAHTVATSQVAIAAMQSEVVRRALAKAAAIRARAMGQGHL